MAECIPSTHMIRAWAEQNLGFKKALAELVDNALDAGATRVTIEFRGTAKAKDRTLLVSDDGRGAPDILAMVRLGAHEEHPGTRSGRYGVGGKDAVLWIGGAESALTIRSVHGNKLSRLSIDWRRLIQIGEWKFDDPTTVQASPEDGRGTTIIVDRVSRHLPSAADWEHVLNELGYIFAPALKRGVQIAIGRDGKQAQPIKKWEPPKLDDGKIVTTVAVGGRTAKLTIGVISSGETTTKRGISYFLEGTRVVQEACAKGCGDGEFSIAHVCGFVELDKSWALTKNKDAIVGGEELYAAVFAAARPILERAQQKSLDVTSQRLRLGVQSAINKAIGEANAKAKRGPRKNKKTHPKPTREGGKHQRAEVEQPGQTFRGGSECGTPPTAAGGCIQVDFADSFEGPSPIGEFHEPNRITMNLKNPAVRAAHGEPNPLAMGGFVALVLAVQELTGRQLRLFKDQIEESDAPKRCLTRVGSLLSQDFVLEGAPIVPMAAE